MFEDKIQRGENQENVWWMWKENASEGAIIAILPEVQYVPYYLMGENAMLDLVHIAE